MPTGTQHQARCHICGLVSDLQELRVNNRGLYSCVAYGDCAEHALRKRLMNFERVDTQEPGYVTVQCVNCPHRVRMSIFTYVRGAARDRLLANHSCFDNYMARVSAIVEEECSKCIGFSSESPMLMASLKGCISAQIEKAKLDGLLPGNLRVHVTPNADPRKVGISIISGSDA